MQTPGIKCRNSLVFMLLYAPEAQLAEQLSTNEKDGWVRLPRGAPNLSACRPILKSRLSLERAISVSLKRYLRIGENPTALTNLIDISVGELEYPVW